METKERYYVMPIAGCTYPVGLIGPYDTYAEMLKIAIETWEGSKQETDAIFYLWIRANGDPTIGSFTGDELNGEDDLEDDDE